MTACALRNEIEAAVAWMEAAAGLLSHGWLYRGGRQTGCFGTGLIPSVVFTVQCFAIHNACGPIVRPHSVKRVLQIHEMLKIVYSKYTKCRFSRSLARCAPKVFRMWAIFWRWGHAWAPFGCDAAIRHGDGELVFAISIQVRRIAKPPLMDSSGGSPISFASL